jgi:3-oxoacyl-[acyl-carrier protein] reductase
MADRPVMVVTGTARGLGRDLAEHYAAQGFEVVGCSRGGSDFAHPHYRHYQVDVADETAVMRMAHEVRRELHGVDVLVNNAGIASMNHALLTPGKTVRAVLDTNVMGTFLFCREFARLMHGRARGRIVNFTTIATPLNLEGEAIYAASKAAVESLTRILARELAPMRITVNAVGPSPIKTALIAGVPAAKMEALLARQAIPRYAEPADVRHVVDFFIHAASDFITGQVVYLGGV